MTRNELLARSEVMQRFITKEFKGVKGADVAACVLFVISLIISQSLDEMVKPESVVMEALFELYNCKGEGSKNENNKNTKNVSLHHPCCE